MALPYSVLKSKRKPHVKIIESFDEISDSKNITVDFNKQINDIIESNLYILPEHIQFISSNINYFYRNNLAILFLTLNIMKSGEAFISSMYYQSFVSYIARKDIKEDKIDTFNIKLNVEIKAYKIKIERLMFNLNMKYI